MAPMRRPQIAHIVDARITLRLEGRRRRGHAPTRHYQLQPAIAVMPDDRPQAIRIDLARLKISDSVDERLAFERVPNLVLGPTLIVEMADVDGPSLVRIAADF